MAQEHARNYEQVDRDRETMLAQLNGLTRVLAMTVSDEAKAAIAAQIGRHRARLALMDTVVQAYDALEADGYPEMVVEPSDVVHQEITELVKANREQVKAQAEQVADELSLVQDVFSGHRRGRRVADPVHVQEPEPPKAVEKK